MGGTHLWRSELVERRSSLVLCTIWRACFSKLLLRASASSRRASRNLPMHVQIQDKITERWGEVPGRHAWLMIPHERADICSFRAHEWMKSRSGASSKKGAECSAVKPRPYLPEGDMRR